MVRPTSAYRLAAAGLAGDVGAANALHLHGDGVHVPAGSVTSPSTALGNTFTVGAWVRMLRPFGSAPNRQTLLIVNGGTNGFQWEFGNGTTGWDGSFSAFMNGSWPATVFQNPNPGVALDSWTHCILIKNGTSIGQNPYSAYINGVSVPMSKINDNDFTDAASQMIVGARGAGQPFFGPVKDVFAYSRVLSQGEIVGIKDSRRFPASNRLFCYTFSEGSGTTAADLFGLAPNLTLDTGSTSWTTASPYTARTAIARRQKMRPGNYAMRNFAASGAVLGGTYGAASALDITGTTAVTCVATLNLVTPSTNCRFFTQGGANAWDWEYNTAGAMTLVKLGVNGVSSSNGFVLFDNKAHRYVMAFDGTNIRWWRDGVLFSGPTAYVAGWASSPGTFGLLGQANFNMGGLAHDVLIYSGYAWTQADVDNDWYEGNLPPVTPAAHWPFAEGFGTTTADTSGNGFTATITQGTFRTEVPHWSLPGTAAKRYPDGFNPFAYLNGGAAYFSDLGATAAAGVISQLNDQSGNGWNMLQATGANKPAYTAGGINGKPFLTYGASGARWMATAGAFVVSDNAPGLTIYVVGSIAADFIGGDFVARTNGAGGATYLWSIGQVGGSTGNFNSSVRNAANTQVNNFGNTNIAPGMATTAIWSMRYDGTHNRSYTNGRPKYQDNQGQVTGNLATAAASQPLVLGFPSAGTGGTVTLYAAIVAIGAHDDDTMRWYHRYLSDYYQIPLLA